MLTERNEAFNINTRRIIEQTWSQAKPSAVKASINRVLLKQDIALNSKQLESLDYALRAAREIWYLNIYGTILLGTYSSVRFVP